MEDILCLEKIKIRIIIIYIKRTLWPRLSEKVKSVSKGFFLLQHKEMKKHQTSFTQHQQDWTEHVNAKSSKLIVHNPIQIKKKHFALSRTH